MKRIVLVRTQGPRNVGSVLRVALNFGPCELVLVRPEKPSILIHPDFVQMSHGVDGIENRVRVVDSMDEALAECTWSYGFTARSRDHRTVFDWRDLQGSLVERVQRPEEHVALVFGSEENGLTTDETRRLNELVKMPTSREHTSINLAMSVGIVLSTIFFADARSAESGGSTPLAGKDRRFLTERLKDVLGSCTTSALTTRPRG